jgi:hypothetical protein
MVASAGWGGQEGASGGKKGRQPGRAHWLAALLAVTRLTWPRRYSMISTLDNSSAPVTPPPVPPLPPHPPHPTPHPHARLPPRLRTRGVVGGVVVEVGDGADEGVGVAHAAHAHLLAGHELQGAVGAKVQHGVGLRGGGARGHQRREGVRSLQARRNCGWRALPGEERTAQSQS